MEQHALIERSFLKFYEELAEPIFRHCYFRVRSREIAEDLTQESFMRLWNYLAKGNKVENPKAFLYRIAGNLIVDHYREKKESSLDALSEGGYDPKGEDADAVTAYAAGEHARAILRKLDAPYRETMILRYIDGLSVGEIAQIVGESENAVSVRIHRGIAKMKKLFHL